MSGPVGRALDLRLLAIDRGDAGARDAFQEVIRRLVKLTYPSARNLDDRSGDWGIDTFHGDLDVGAIVVWQAKYFLNGVGPAQQAQIRESLKQVVAKAHLLGVAVSAWTLCISCRLTPEMTQWWDGYRRRQQRETGIVISMWDQDRVEDMLRSPDATHIREAFFGSSLALPRRTEDLPDEAMYDETLFVAQLRAARIAELSAAKKAFFNAEILAREVVAKAVDEELRELEDLSTDLHQIWEIRFNDACARLDDDALPGMYPRMMDEIKDRSWRHVRLPAGLIHRLGQMHRLVEAEKAGWTRGWRDVAERHGR
jgi:hypothetical protein